MAFAVSCSIMQAILTRFSWFIIHSFLNLNPTSIYAPWHLKNRLGDIETDSRDRLHDWLLRIVGALTAPTSMAVEEPSTASKAEVLVTGSVSQKAAHNHVT
jgi:hypothetical protein